MALDYYQIQEDLQTILKAGPASGYTNAPLFVFIEAMDRETTFDRMPFINIRLIEADIEMITIPNGYYGNITFEIDIITFDLSEFKKASNLRDDLLREAQLAVQQTAAFSAQIQTSQLGGVSFGVGTPEGANGHVAMCTFTVVAEAYIEPT